MKIITKEIQTAFDKQGDTSDKCADAIYVVCKLFNPVGAGTWYLYEQMKDNPDIYWCFATLGDIDLAELGTVSMSELMSARLPFGLSIERDMQFPILKHKLSDVMTIIKRGDHI